MPQTTPWVILILATVTTLMAGPANTAPMEETSKHSHHVPAFRHSRVVRSAASLKDCSLDDPNSGAPCLASQCSDGGAYLLADWRMDLRIATCACYVDIPNAPRYKGTTLIWYQKINGTQTIVEGGTIYNNNSGAYPYRLTHTVHINMFLYPDDKTNYTCAVEGISNPPKPQAVDIPYDVAPKMRVSPTTNTTCPPTILLGGVLECVCHVSSHGLPRHEPVWFHRYSAKGEVPLAEKDDVTEGRGSFSNSSDGESSTATMMLVAKQKNQNQNDTKTYVCRAVSAATVAFVRVADIEYVVTVRDRTDYAKASSNRSRIVLMCLGVVSLAVGCFLVMAYRARHKDPLVRDTAKSKRPSLYNMNPRKFSTPIVKAARSKYRGMNKDSNKTADKKAIQMLRHYRETVNGRNNTDSTVWTAASTQV